MRCLSPQQLPFLWDESKATLSEAMTAESYSETLKSNPSDLEALDNRKEMACQGMQANLCFADQQPGEGLEPGFQPFPP